MKILGICHDVLICSAAVIVDGQVVAAIPEERLDRRKQSRVFPTLAIRRCLEEAGLKLHEIDEIAVGWNPSIELENVPGGFLARRWRSEHLSQVPAQFMRLAGTHATNEMSISGTAEKVPTITFVNHYDAHIGNAFFLSPYEEAAIIVLDGRAERQTSLLARGSGTKIERLAEMQFPHSLGLFYGAITQFLGFRPDSDEWKVMALASYASGDNEFYAPMSKLIRVNDDGTFELALEYFEFYNFYDSRMFSDAFVKLFGTPRQSSEALTERHQRIAAAMQRVFEETVTAILKALHARTGLTRLVATGGCFMNSVYNGKISELTPFKEAYITSCPDDSGTSIGAALWLHGQRGGARTKAPTHNYWGPEYSDAACLDAAKRFKLNATATDDPSGRAAQDLVDGKIVGWFQGRMEFGQRALGNRSILLDPRRKDGKDVVNAAIKFREAFRPFAPAILAEEVNNWFECEPNSLVPFMEKVFMFRPEKRELVPSVVNADGSGRLQTVDEHS
ncbi:MAG TPA: carbamoyltransferase N-terminal domain-containing protein, partial [Polyangiaceae bacterium]|nr:carbamoyltransferase N-terminal domain-containing protein [Polyangiaceae bacterium]